MHVEYTIKTHEFQNFFEKEKIKWKTVRISIKMAKIRKIWKILKNKKDIIIGIKSNSSIIVLLNRNFDKLIKIIIDLIHN